MGYICQQKSCLAQAVDGVPITHYQAEAIRWAKSCTSDGVLQVLHVLHVGRYVGPSATRQKNCFCQGVGCTSDAEYELQVKTRLTNLQEKLRSKPDYTKLRIY